MGFRIAWIGVMDTPEDQLLALQGLEIAGDGNDAVLYRVDDWRIFTFDFMFPDPALMAAVSAGTEAASVVANDTVMYSHLEMWSEGRLVWKLTHDGETGPQDLRVEGEPPPIYRQLIDRQLEWRAGSHYYEIPIAIANQATGFAHNSDLIADYPRLPLRRTGAGPQLPPPAAPESNTSEEAVGSTGETPAEPQGILGRLFGRG